MYDVSNPYPPKPHDLLHTELWINTNSIIIIFEDGEREKTFFIEANSIHDVQFFHRQYHSIYLSFFTFLKKAFLCEKLESLVYNIFIITQS